MGERTLLCPFGQFVAPNALADGMLVLDLSLGLEPVVLEQEHRSLVDDIRVAPCMMSEFGYG